MDLDGLSPPSAGRQPGAISTLVSLFLLLLVFFIVLFSIADVHRPRMTEVLSSIDRAFGGIPSELGLLPPPVPEADPASPAQFMADATLLLTGFPPAQSVAAAGGGLLTVSLPKSRLFLRIKPPVLSATARRLVPPLAVLLQRQQGARLHYRLDLRMADGDAALVLASLAAALFDAGCPADRLSIGIDEAAGDGIRFSFAMVEAPEEKH
jgi:hypothetical protein